MAYIFIAVVAVLVAALTLFSGFGLGTILMPVFALFFPIEIAIAATAVVHLANNVFKVLLVGRKANLKIVAIFALPAALAAVAGAFLLGFVSKMEPIATYSIGMRDFQIMPASFVIGILIAFFGVTELMKFFEDRALDRKYVPIGGLLSGFFGGLSGHQGALRTTFLVKLGMPKEQFVGTVVVSAVIVDVFRIVVYGMTFLAAREDITAGEGARVAVLVAIVAAFAGSFAASRLLKKITMGAINKIVGVMLIALGLALAVGMV
jgi:hypothetical protein